MNYTIHRRFAAFAAGICVLLASLPGAHAEYYINESGDTVESVQGAYAVGGSGESEILGDAPMYALTKDGVVLIGEPATPPSQPPVQANVPTMYVGVSFGGTEVSTATLTNSVGSGYRFGFYDANRVFYEVGATSETGLTMMKDKNITVSAGMVGCYHILLSATYNSFADAQAAASAYSDGFPAYYNGTYRVLVGSYETSTSAANAVYSRGISGQAYSASSKCVVVTKTGSTKILFEFDYGDTLSLAVRPVSSSGKAITSYGTRTYYGDFTFRRLSGDNMTIVNAISMDDYIKGVVPYEMSPSWPLEALKAQAICARTYAAANMNKHRTYGFDTCNGVDCQAYLGTGSANSNTNLAVDSTVNKFVTYNGALCTTLYFSSDGGATEDNENINVQPFPYLKGVVDPYEKDIEQDYYGKSWSWNPTARDLKSVLTTKGYSIGDIVSVEPTYTRMNNMYSLKFTDTAGKSVTITKYQCVSVMNSMGIKILSVHYTLKRSETDPNQYIIQGSGWGHNVGMSQWGAYSMAKYHNKTYEEIIKFYYTGVAVG